MESRSGPFPTSKRDLLYGMEFLRGFSALSVLLLHYQHFYYRTPLLKATDEDRIGQPFWNALEPIYIHGALGVQVFWVVSGVVLSSVYFRTTTTHKIDNFLINRFSRIYPLHFITLIFLVIAQTVSESLTGHAQIYDHNSFSNFILHFFMLVGFRNDTNYGYNGVIWSVSVELALYLIFFLCLRFVRRRLFFSSLMLLFFAFSDRLFPTAQVLECGKYFFLGVFLYLLYNKSRHLMLAVAIMMLIFRILFPDQHVFISISLLASIFLYLERFLRLFPHFILSCIRLIGEISYSLYLLHLPLQVILLTLFNCMGWSSSIIANDERFFLSYFAILLLLGNFSYRYVEMPLRDRLRFRLERNSPS
jgi:peptidoglycan/LPS O-acetylase OafA/YrhL